MMVDLNAVVQEARSWLGTPYVHQHREKGYAVDCAGVWIGVSRALGLVEPTFDITGYSRSPDGTSLIEACEKFMGRRLRLDELRPGHGVVLRFNDDPQHLGVVVPYKAPGMLAFVHAYSLATPPRVVEHRLFRTETMVPVCGYAFPGVVG